MFNFSMLSHFLLALAASVGIIVMDEDPTSVSPEEWVLYALLLYSAFSFLRFYIEAKLKEPES